MRGRVVLAWLFGTAIVLAPVGSAAQRGVPYPASMAALGDSLTLAFDASAVAYSWSTGTTRSVQSHYLRILAANPAIKGKAYNLAVGGRDVR